MYGGCVSWRGSYPGVVADVKQSQPKSIILPESDTCAWICFIGDTSTTPTIETNTTRSSLFPVSTPLRVHEILCKLLQFLLFLYALSRKPPTPYSKSYFEKHASSWFLFQIFLVFIFIILMLDFWYKALFLLSNFLWILFACRYFCKIDSKKVMCTLSFFLPVFICLHKTHYRKPFTRELLCCCNNWYRKVMWRSCCTKQTSFFSE